MPNYRNTVIYKIIHNDGGFVYIGHTTNFEERRKAHRKCALYGHGKENCFLYQYINKNGGWDDFKMVWIEDSPCDSKKEASAKEQDWIDHFRENEMCINVQNAFGPDTKRKNAYKKKYEQENKEIIAQRHKEWRENNKEYVAQKNKEWRENNKEYVAQKNKEWHKNNKEHIKEYILKNRERDRAKEAIRREKNRDQVNAYARIKFDCKCGGKYTHAGISTHKKCQKHQDWLLTCHNVVQVG